MRPAAALCQLLRRHMVAEQKKKKNRLGCDLPETERTALDRLVANVNFRKELRQVLGGWRARISLCLGPWQTGRPVHASVSSVGQCAGRFRLAALAACVGRTRPQRHSPRPRGDGPMQEQDRAVRLGIRDTDTPSPPTPADPLFRPS